MTRHSALTNEDDLHYSKIRTFSGAPTALSPDFANQILCATDTNKIYRATGTTAGNIVELTASPPNGNGESQNLAPLPLVDFGYPMSVIPSAIGQTYFDTESRRLFIAKGLTPFDWIPTSSTFELVINVSNLSSVEDSRIKLVLLHTETQPLNGQQLSEVIASGVYLENGAYFFDKTSDLCKKVFAKGRGYYFLGYEYIGQEDPIPLVNVAMSSYNDYYSDNILSIAANSYANGLTYNGFAVSGLGFNIVQYPINASPDTIPEFFYNFVINDG